MASETNEAVQSGKAVSGSMDNEKLLKTHSRMQDSCSDNNSGRFQWSLTQVPIQLTITTIEDFQKHVKRLKQLLCLTNVGTYQPKMALENSTCLGPSIVSKTIAIGPLYVVTVQKSWEFAVLNSNKEKLNMRK